MAMNALSGRSANRPPTSTGLPLNTGATYSMSRALRKARICKGTGSVTCASRVSAPKAARISSNRLATSCPLPSPASVYTEKFSDFTSTRSWAVDNRGAHASSNARLEKTTEDDRRGIATQCPRIWQSEQVTVRARPWPDARRGIRLRLPYAAARELILGLQLDLVSDLDHPGTHHVGVNADLALVLLRHRAQHARVLADSVGVQVDHHAAAVALRDAEHHVGADAQQRSGPLLFVECLARLGFDIDVGAELARIDLRARFLGQSAHRRQVEDRDVLAVEHATRAAQQEHGLLQLRRDLVA